MYILLALSILVCAWFFAVGFTCVTLWFYKGALGPVPEKFVIIPLHRKKKAQEHSHARATGADIHNKRATMFPHVTEASKRKTVFPHVTEPQAPIASPFADEYAIPSSQLYANVIPAITIEDMDDDVDEEGINNYAEFQSPEEVRRYIAEERRISRLPAFTQDDCGDGTDFPAVPYATEPVQSRRVPLEAVRAYLDFRMTKDLRRDQWLNIPGGPDDMHNARLKLLDQKTSECVQVKAGGEAPCEELLGEVVRPIGDACHEKRWSIYTKFDKDHIKDRHTHEDYCLARPYEHHPIELCARLVGADFNVFVKDMFTRKWYL